MSLNSLTENAASSCQETYGVILSATFFPQMHFSPFVTTFTFFNWVFGLCFPMIYRYQRSFVIPMGYRHSVWTLRAILWFAQHSAHPPNPSTLYQAVLLSRCSMYFHHCHALSPFLDIVLRRVTSEYLIHTSRKLINPKKQHMHKLSLFYTLL